MNRLLTEAIAFAAVAKAGADQVSEGLAKRAAEKWEHSKQLPRKAKKLMRKDALLDWAFSQDVLLTTKQILGF